MRSRFAANLELTGAPLDARVRLLDRFAFVTVCALIFGTTWELEGPLIAGAMISHWLGLMAVGAMLLRTLAMGRLRRPCALHWLMGAFATWSALTVIWSIAPESTLTRTGTYLQMLVMVWLMWEVASTRDRVSGLLLSYVLGTYVPSLTTIHNFLIGRTAADIHFGAANDVTFERRYTAAGFNENDLGFMLVLSLPMTLYLLTRPRQRSTVKWLCYLQLVLATATILLTGSRGALISFVIALGMLPVSYRAFSRSQKRALAFVLVGVLACGAYMVPAATWRRLETTGSELENGTMSNRTNIWAAGLSVFLDHPICGIGSGAFAAGVLSRDDTTYTSHNTYLSVLAETGVIGGFILFALLAPMFYCVFRMPRLERALWLVLLLTWSLGVCSRTWEHRKPTWFLFGMIAAEAGLARARKPAAIPVRRRQAAAGRVAFSA